MKRIQPRWKLSALSCALFAFMSPTWAADSTADTTTTDSSAPQTDPVQTLATLKFEAAPAQAKDPDISAVAKTIVTREEMLQFGDQSVNDALRRAAGFQMPAPGQGPRGGGGASAMRFRGGGAPIFLINGEPVQGGPRGGMSVVDSITPDMIERIEITNSQVSLRPLWHLPLSSILF